MLIYGVAVTVVVKVGELVIGGSVAVDAGATVVLRVGVGASNVSTKSTVTVIVGVEMT